MSATLIEALDEAATVSTRGFVFVEDSGRERFRSFADLHEAAGRRGRQLGALGLRRGDRVGVLLTRPEDFVVTFFGAIRAGVTPVPLAPPLSFAALEAYVRSLAAVLRASDAAMLVTERRLTALFWRLRRRVPSLRRVITLAHLQGRDPGPSEFPRITPDDPAFLQFTSGSTGAPRGVVVSHRSLMANATAIVKIGLRAEARDVGVSWLPLYHDMGLIGFIIGPLLLKAHAVLIPPLRFLKHPSVWMDAIHRHRATVTFAPNFALALAARRARPEELARWDLSCLRVVGCGAEPINAMVLREFVDAFSGPCGLPTTAVLPCYGMAEATLAITFSPVGEGFRIDRIDANRFAAEGVAIPVAEAFSGPTREVVSCGQPFPGHEVRILADGGAPLPERREGHIVVRGPSLASGYFRDPAATDEVFREGWLHTGDLGYLADGHLYVSGRAKDCVILNGRNYHPQDIEWVAGRVDGVRKGGVIAFARPAMRTEELVVAAEVRPGNGGDVAAAIRKAIQRELSLPVADVVLLPPGSLPKTTSGKLQRARARAQYLAGGLVPAATKPAHERPTRAVAGYLARSLWEAVRQQDSRDVDPG